MGENAEVKIDFQNHRITALPDFCFDNDVVLHCQSHVRDLWKQKRVLLVLNHKIDDIWLV
jgi:hypothetical protein